ncbi:DUF4382 domain-containing protein [candidate division KSB1 bacterium]|nr:DUF4382 domain-containing protein [candidate division KSB1 bacterium]NIR68771.1 DUF4382 domain-containing protein [candidate division KSB1 bacterium]NIS24009.1 DUF4382 domain-containing protein [candidate division KSB1 bacterium]NIT70936.1 DUF4382 domain-containing protein [candidate division KSB1 bacterium]NIU24657.1 DUF4382 domain-containing protein [candidate division KSB1 bacterium]
MTFSEVSAHVNNEWITVSLDPMTVNLLEFTNGRTVEIGSADRVNRAFRLKIDDAQVVVDGETIL